MPIPFLRWIGSNERQEAFLLSADETVIGRSSDADLILPGLSVSRRHARVIRSSAGYTLVDLASSHGTYVNGNRVDRHLLVVGDRLRFGSEALELAFTIENIESTRTTDMWEDEQFEQSLANLATIVPSQDSEYTDLEKISCILDFHYNCGKDFSPENTFQQTVRSALEISGAERGFILLQSPGGFRYEVGMNADGAVLSEGEFRTSQSIVKRAADERKPVLMMEEIGGEFAQQASIVAMNLRSVACLPLEAMSSSTETDTPEVLGILYLDSTHQMHALSGLDEKILTKLAEQAATVLEKLEMIKGLEARKKMEQELELAQETQRSLLPQSVPQFENYHIHAYSQPTRYVGGDFYDFLQLGAGSWAGVLADVSGKGISAALLGSLVQGALAAELRSQGDLGQVVCRVNKFLVEKSSAHRFVTMFLLRLDSEGKGEYISAGHNPAFLYRAETGEIEELGSGGLILGAFDFAAYESHPFQLAKDDTLLVYSDGFTEAENPQGEMMGEDRVREILCREALSGSHVLERKLLQGIEYFTQGRGQTDDITFLLVNRTV